MNSLIIAWRTKLQQALFYHTANRKVRLSTPRDIERGV